MTPRTPAGELPGHLHLEVRVFVPSRRLRVFVTVCIIAASLWTLLGSAAAPGGLQSASAASDPVIAAAGDIACDPANSHYNNGLGTSKNCRQKYTSDLLVNAGLDGVLDLGDNQYYCGGLPAFQQVYDSTWGRVKSITHPSVGNHEYLTAGGTGCDITNEGAAGYFNYFGSAAGTAGQGWYSFDIGTWHIIALNSNCSDAGGCGSSSPQYSWLQSDLAAHPNYCTLAFWHIPLYSSGGRAAQNSKPFWTLLYNNNADVILNGHDHIYERFAPQDPNGAVDLARGIKQFTVGTGGSDHTTITTVAANSELRNTDTFGVLKLTLHATSYDWQFVHEAGKTFTDSGTANCHGATGPTSTPTTAASNTPTPTPGAPTSTPTGTPSSLPTFTPTATASSGGSVTFTPQADSYVNSANATTNYGTLTSLRADGSPDVHSYARFVVSGLAGRAITRARLLLYMNSSSTSDLKAWAVSDNTWGETTLNYNNAPALGANLATSGTLTTGAWATMDISSYITGEGTYSLGITTPGSTALSIGSREAGANAPQLVLDLAALPTPTNTNTPTATVSNTLTFTPTSTSTATPTSTATSTPTAAATSTSTPPPTNTPTASPTNTATAASTSTPTVTPTTAPTSTPTETPTSVLPTSTPTSSDTPEPIPTDTPTATSTPLPTSTSTLAPTATNTSTPTPTNVVLPTDTPTPTAVSVPTDTATPTPTLAATSTPTSTPTPTPTANSGQTITLTPAADSYVDSANPTKNYGAAIALRADGSPDVHSYVRFTVSGLNGASITRVRLSFYVNSGTSSGIWALEVADNTWGEQTVVYNTAPTMGSTIASSGALTNSTRVTLDVTTYVTGEGTYSFGIITPGSTAINLASRETGANSPQLIIDLGP